MEKKEEEEKMTAEDLQKLIEKEGGLEYWTYERNDRYKCRIQRTKGIGIWCGYVAIPEGHPCYGMHYDDVHKEYPELKVHGGLTYSEKIVNYHRDYEEGYWELGFDCAHADDVIPTLDNILDPPMHLARTITNLFEGVRDTVTYKNKIWVWNETNELAFQLEEIEKKEERRKKRKKQRNKK